MQWDDTCHPCRRYLGSDRLSTNARLEQKAARLRRRFRQKNLDRTFRRPRYRPVACDSSRPSCRGHRDDSKSLRGSRRTCTQSPPGGGKKSGGAFQHPRHLNRVPGLAPAGGVTEPVQFLSDRAQGLPGFPQFRDDRHQVGVCRVGPGLARHCRGLCALQSRLRGQVAALRQRAAQRATTGLVSREGGPAARGSSCDLS